MESEIEKKYKQTLLLQKIISDYVDNEHKLTERKWRIPGHCDIHGDVLKYKCLSVNMKQKEGYMRRDVYIKRYGTQPTCSCFVD